MSLSIESGFRTTAKIAGYDAVRALPWFALHLRSRCEKMVSEILRGKGYEELLPLYRGHAYFGRRKEVCLPLFPGYIFCRFDPRWRLPILTTPGVVSIVGLGKAPQPVDEAELAAVRAIVKSGRPASPWPYLGTGQWVRIERGALAGIEGIVTQVKNDLRVVVSVTLLQRSVAVEIDRDCICPINRRKYSGSA